MKDRIKIVPMREEVEVRIPDGRVLSGPRGATVGEFLAAVVEPEPQTVGAVVNGVLRELTFPIEIESVIQPVTIADPDGARIYRRSLNFSARNGVRRPVPGRHPICGPFRRLGRVLLSGFGARSAVRGPRSKR
jgi:hypothetical protein